MGKSKAKAKGKRRRTAAKTMPPPIPDTPENVAAALFPSQEVAPRPRSERAKDKGDSDSADSG